MKSQTATDPTIQAKQFYEEGIKLYNQNNKQAALDSFISSMKASFQYHHEILEFLLSKGEIDMVATLRDQDSFTNPHDQSFAPHSITEAHGCPIPTDVPAPVDIFSKFSLWNPLPKFKNTLYSGLNSGQKDDLVVLKESSCMLVYRIYGYYFQVGTGVLVSSEKIFAAKHSFLFLSPNPVMRLYAIFNYTEKQDCKFYQIQKVSSFHVVEDIAVLTTCVKVLGQRPAEIEFTDDLFGDYYIAHHAGGYPLQLSTGTIPTYGDKVKVLEFDILAHAGPLASGSGIFSTNRKLVAISPRRSIGLGAISRKPLLLINAKDWILQQLADNSAVDVPTSEDVYYLDTPPEPVDLTCEDLYCDSPETMSWRKLKPLADLIFGYLKNLSAYLHDNTILCVPPDKLLSDRRDSRDSHQYQHFEVSQRGKKTICNPNIGKTEKDPKFLALLFSTSIIFSIFVTRIKKGECLSNFTKNRDAEFTTFAIDYSGFGLIVDDNNTTSMFYLDGDPTEKFHIWPLPANHPKLTNKESTLAVIDALAVLDHVRAYQVQPPIKLRYN